MEAAEWCAVQITYESLPRSRLPVYGLRSTTYVVALVVLVAKVGAGGKENNAGREADGQAGQLAQLGIRAGFVAHSGGVAAETSRDGLCRV